MTRDEAKQLVCRVAGASIYDLMALVVPDLFVPAASEPTRVQLDARRLRSAARELEAELRRRGDRRSAASIGAKARARETAR